MLSQEARNTSAYIYEQLSKYGPVESLKMQKLMYYVNGWSLAIRGATSFNDPIEAWKHGPVISDLYSYHSGDITLPINWVAAISGNPSDLSLDDRKIIDFVINKYGSLSGWGLRNLTHTESPWLDSWAESDEGKSRNYRIDNNKIETYFKSLIK